MTSGEYNGHIMDPHSKKIIETLLENPEREFNKKELAEVAGVSRDALYRRWEPLNQLDILQDNGSNYKLNATKAWYIISENSSKTSKKLKQMFNSCFKFGG